MKFARLGGRASLTLDGKVVDWTDATSAFFVEGLTVGSGNVVGMLINDLTNPFYAELAVGIERVFQSAGYVPLIANTAESVIRQAEVLKSIREQGVAGLIISAARGTPAAAIRDFTQAGIPVVLVMRQVAGARASAVVPDNRRGASEAVEHLAARRLEARERLVDVHRLLDPVELALARALDRPVVQVLGRHGRPAALGDAVDADAPRDLRDPRPQSVVVAQRPEPVVDAEDLLLCERFSRQKFLGE